MTRSDFCSSLTMKTRWVISPCGTLWSSISWRTSSRRNLRTSPSTPRSRVALNSMRWPPCGRGGEDAGDAGKEAEVGHVVGLVEHGDLDAVEAHVALLHEVFEAAGAGHDDVDAGTQRRLLRLLADAAEDRRDGEAGCRSEGLDGGGDLRRELAGRCEHETAGAAGGAARGESARQAGDEGKGERDGLAAAGAAAAEHVVTGERVGQRVALDREGFGLALTGEDVGQRRGHAEVEESRHSGCFRMARRRKGVKRATARVRASVRRVKRTAAEKAAKRDNDAGRREPPRSRLARQVARRLCDAMLGIRRTHDETVITFPSRACTTA